MNKNEQDIWNNTLTNQSRKMMMTKYLRILSLKLSQMNFHFETNNVYVC